MLFPDDLSVCFLSVPFIHNTEIKENDRHKSEGNKGEKRKRLAQTTRDWQSVLAALLVNILLQGADWQLKGVNDITCTCLSHTGWQVQNPKARILVDL